MTRPVVKILLDEHYPGWLAEELRADGIDADAVVERIDLRGADDTSVLRTATAEGRLVVTEDVTTFQPTLFRLVVVSVTSWPGIRHSQPSAIPSD